MTITVTFIDHDDTPYAVSASPGMTLMETAVSNTVPGIAAECGGACACATCHVFVDDEWVTRLPDKADGEIAMLEFAAGRQENSRLSCQIQLTDALDGLTVRLPQTQY
ncbi:2Fe-2S iron-sulfur cluster-binding protein [Microbacteriaceae bacterium K1510]|nr:2Fe-2S iron-sulfur cluster-binding protein [Microbacteriaceae bacterium K1510]